MCVFLTNELLAKLEPIFKNSHRLFWSVLNFYIAFRIKSDQRVILTAYGDVMLCHYRGGKIMHLGYHPGLATAEERKSAGQKSSVTPPQESTSVNNSAAMVTATTPSFPASASSIKTVSAK